MSPSTAITLIIASFFPGVLAAISGFVYYTIRVA